MPDYLSLTERELQVLELRTSEDPFLSHNVVAERLGWKRDAVKNAWRKALAKIEIGRDIKNDPNQRWRERFENREPENGAAAIDALTDPLREKKYESNTKLAKQLGISTHTLKALEYRLATKYQPLKFEVEQVKTQHLIELLGDRAKRTLESIDELDIAQASLKDKALAAAIMIDKMQLLEGKPTQILSHDDRVTLNELLPVIYTEMKRRGLDGFPDPETQQVRILEAEVVEP